MNLRQKADELPAVEYSPPPSRQPKPAPLPPDPIVCRAAQRIEQHGEEIIRWIEESIRDVTAYYAQRIVRRAIYKLAMKREEIENNLPDDHEAICPADRCIRRTYKECFNSLLRIGERIMVDDERERYKTEVVRPQQLLPEMFVSVEGDYEGVFAGDFTTTTTDASVPSRDFQRQTVRTSS